MKTYNGMDFFTKIENEDEKLQSYVNIYEGLANFITDYEMLKGKNHLSQKDIAKSMKTTQSAISRIEILKTNPSYKTLCNLSSAVKGELYLTPMGNMTITVPYDLQEKVQNIADSKKISTKEYLLNEIRKSVDLHYESEAEKFEMRTKSYKNRIPQISDFEEKELDNTTTPNPEADFSLAA
ncbi:MAG: helix-turn-helix transcriptional regulator [Treponema sp.]|nr:helix-turn-helix transcriptional regulator [Treponema sp.]